MKFKTVAEAFNYYRNFTNEALEKRAQEIKGTIETDPDVDINSLNIELTAIKEAKDNNKDKEDETNKRGENMNVITGMNTDNKKKVFTADTVVDTAEYRSAFYKSLLGKELNEVEKEAFKVGTQVAEKRSDEFNASGDSLAILPTTTLNEVVKKARTIGGLMAECRAFNVPTKIAIPVGTPGSKANWHTEGASVDTEKASLASVTFDGYEIIKIFSISAKVRKMSINAFEAYLTDELTACVMECIADSLVNGTGSNQGTGLEAITWVDGTNAIEVENLNDWTDITKLVAMLKRGYNQGAKFAMNNATLYKNIYGMHDDNNRPIFVADLKTEEVGKLLGFEVVIDDNIADDVIYFGNYAKYLGYNMPDGIAIEVSTQSSFKKGLIDYRALAIADCKPIVNEAFVKLYVPADDDLTA